MLSGIQNIPTCEENSVNVYVDITTGHTNEENRHPPIHMDEQGHIVNISNFWRHWNSTGRHKSETAQGRHNVFTGRNNKAE